MKKVYLFFCFLTLAALSIANTRYSVEGSYASSTMNFSTNPNGLGYNPGYGAGIGAGFFSGQLFQLNLGLEYVQRGYKITDTFDNYSFVGGNFVKVGTTNYVSSASLNYLLLRPSLGFKIPFDFVTPTFSLGPYAGVLLGGQQSIQVDSGPASTSPINMGLANAVDAGVTAGIGAEFLSGSKFSPYVHLRYDLGLMPYSKSGSDYHRSFVISVGVLY